MAATSTTPKIRLIALIVGLVLTNALVVSVRKCSHFKNEAHTYQDSTTYYKNSAAYFKVKASEECQQKVDSLKVWYLKTKQQDETTIQNLTNDAPSWLR